MAAALTSSSGPVAVEQNVPAARWATSSDHRGAALLATEGQRHPCPGARSAARVGHDPSVADRDTARVPDFASLYGGPDSALSPRLAAYLWAAAGVLSDTYRGPDGRETLVEDLPPLVARVADDAWYDRFAVCFDELEGRIAAGDGDGERLACCTGEEMALHLIVAMSETLVEAGSLDELPLMGSLPPWRAGDDGPERARTVLFRDHDVLWLFEASLDGVEAADSDESAYFGLAHMHPREWFNRFDDCPEGSADPQT